MAGLGYLADGIGAVLVADHSANVAQFTFVGEVVLIFWLLSRWRRAAVKVDPALAAR